MKRGVKGALLSGVILPGLGQLWLKTYLRGAVLILAVSASLAVVVYKAVHQAYSILEQAEAEGGAIDMVAIVKMATRASSPPNDAATRAAVVIMVLCWIIGVADAYITGSKADRDDRQR